MSEATSQLADPTNPEAQWRYEVGLPYVDYAQRAIDDARDAYRKEYGDRVPNGLIWSARKVPIDEEEPDGPQGGLL